MRPILEGNHRRTRAMIVAGIACDGSKASRANWSTHGLVRYRFTSLNELPNRASSYAFHGGQVMARGIIRNRIKRRVFDALLVAGVLALAPTVFSSQASAQAFNYAPAAPASFPSDNLMAAPDSARSDEAGSS